MTDDIDLNIAHIIHRFNVPEFPGDFIQCLRGFYYTVQYGSMTAAAVYMKRNQSAISHQIKTIESEFGVKLFQGTKSNRVLTEEGKFLLTQVVELFSVINEIKMNIGDIQSDVKGEISIAATPYIPFDYLSARFTAFSNRYPGILFRHVSESDQESLFRRIETGEIDFGLLSADNIPQQFDSATLFTADIVLVTPHSGPYALTEVPPLEELSQTSFLASSLRSRLWQSIIRQFARHGHKLKYSHVFGDQQILMLCVAAGMGVTILDEFICSGDARNQVNSLSLSRYFTPQIYSVVWRSNLYMHPHQRTFLNFLHECGLAEKESPSCPG